MVIYCMSVEDFEEKIWETQGVRIRTGIDLKSKIIAHESVFKRVKDAVTVDDFKNFLYRHIKVLQNKRIQKINS